MTENTGTKIILHASPYFHVPIILPIAIYFISQDRDVRNLAIQALLFQLMFLATLIGGAIITCSLSILGIFGGLSLSMLFNNPAGFMFGVAPTGVLLLMLIVTLGLLYYITPLIGIIYAIKGRPFSYPIVGRFVVSKEF